MFLEEREFTRLVGAAGREKSVEPVRFDESDGGDEGGCDDRGERVGRSQVVGRLRVKGWDNVNALKE